MQRILVVVDMQRDFVDGALGTAEAVKIVPDVVKRVTEGIENGERIFFTRDTHQEDYLKTQEGRNLPVEHCIQGTEGWQIIPELQQFIQGRTVIDKPTFGSQRLGQLLLKANEEEPIEQITLVGVCTDICVISNALLAKAFLPEADIRVKAECCAGVTPESHENALNAMRVCQISIV